MTQARSKLVSVADTPYYHCTGRCVRRAFLCGEDRLTGRSFEHRRGWLAERLALLTEVFAIDLCGYALMSNHYHLVLRLAPARTKKWSHGDVIDRWCRIFNGLPLLNRYREGQALSSAEADLAARTIELWRERLGSLSWFMRCLNEFIARRANEEDGCTGRFWEGRFSSQALLDEQAVLAAMAYVDLNPVRARIAKSLEDSDYTSIQARLRAAPDEPRSPRLAPFAGRRASPFIDSIPFTWPAYVELVDATGRILRSDKRGFLADEVPRLLDTFALDPNEWLLSVTRMPRRFERALGAPRLLQQLACKTGQRWFRGQRAARRLYAHALD